MIKVGFFLAHFEVGGMEKVVLNLIQNLDRRQFKAVLILGARRGEFLKHVPGDVEIAYLDGHRLRQQLMSLTRVLNKLRCDFVYSGTNSTNLTLLAASFLTRFKSKILVSEHTTPSLFLETAKLAPLRKFLMRRLYPRATALIVPVPPIAEELSTRLRLRVTTAVLANPIIPDSWFSPSVESRSPYRADGPNFVSIGRLVSLKGFDILLTAFSLIHEELPTATLTIIGEGPEHDRLSRDIVRLSLEDKVSIVRNTSDTRPYYVHADALVLSSRREGFGNVLVEAMACGTPTISADCPVGPRVVTRNGTCGMLVAPESATALADGMRTLLADESLAAEYSRKGRARAESFAISRCVNEFEEYVSRLA